MPDRRPPQKRHGDRVALNPRQLQRILDGRDHAIAGTIDALTRRVEALERRHAERTQGTNASLRTLQQQLANTGSLSYADYTATDGFGQTIVVEAPKYLAPPPITKVTWWSRLRSLFSRA